MRVLLRNIVAHPDEDKYRSIKLKNRTMEKKLWPAAGAKEYMTHVLGFAEVSATLSQGGGTKEKVDPHEGNPRYPKRQKAHKTHPPKTFPSSK